MQVAGEVDEGVGERVAVTSVVGFIDGVGIAIAEDVERTTFFAAPSAPLPLTSL